MTSRFLSTACIWCLLCGFTAAAESVAFRTRAGPKNVFSPRVTVTPWNAVATWSLGDGSPDKSGTIINHTYGMEGEKTVTVSVPDGASITVLNLNNCFISGFPEGIASLPKLTGLVLSNNYETLKETPIPDSLGDCVSLRTIAFYHSGLAGPLPASLGNLINLETLDISANIYDAKWSGQITGPIPSELGNCVNLQTIKLGCNKLTGAIPPELAQCANLRVLDLSRNQLSGDIPLELTTLAELRELTLNYNQLAGLVHVAFADLRNLEKLELSSNRLTGTIPVELGTLGKLNALGLGSNQLTGSIPIELGNCPNLAYLNLGVNRLVGTIPIELGNCLKLSNLYLQSNMLTGTIPIELGNCDLVELKMSANGLTGGIPVELGACARLRTLHLDRNQLTGPIPVELGNCLQLVSVFMSGNQLSGTIPRELGNCRQLAYLCIDSNRLTGAIPAELGNCTKMLQLFLGGNQLTGTVPPELGNLTLMYYLTLGGNQITGAFPEEMANCTRMTYFSAASNKLDGFDAGIIGAWINIKSCDLRNNNLDTATLERMIDEVYESRVQYTSNPAMSLDGTNQGVRGFFRGADPQVTAQEKRWYLMNSTDGFRPDPKLAPDDPANVRGDRFLHWTIRVNWANTLPVAVAEGPESVGEHTVVTCDGSKSHDDDADALTYAWAQTAGPAVTLNNANTAYPSFAAPEVGRDGAILSFQLTVTDIYGGKGIDTIVVKVLNVNQAPTAVAEGPEEVLENATVTWDGSKSSDPDGDTLTYVWVQTAGPAVVVNGADTAKPTFVAPEVDPSGATLDFQLTVTDLEGLTSTDTVTIKVVNVNQAPTAVAEGPEEVDDVTLVTLDGGKSSDPDGDTLIYAWVQVSGPAVVLDGADTANPTFIAPDVRSYYDSQALLTFQLGVTDPEGLTGADTVSINVLHVNHAPVAEADGPEQVDESTLVALDGGRSSDPDGDLLSFHWVQISGPTVVLNGADTKTPSFTAPEVLPIGTTVVFQLTVSDPDGLAATDTVTVQVLNVNAPPVAVAEGPDLTMTGMLVILDGAKSHDPDGDILAYQWTQLAGPTVVLHGANTATPRFIAPSVGSEALIFQLGVTDPSGLRAADTVTIRVHKPGVVLDGPAILWPPNHKMTNYWVDYRLLCPDGDAAVIVTGIRQDEVVKFNNGDPSPDGIMGIDGSLDRLQLRAERIGGGNGRMYTISYTLEYAGGGSFSDVLKVPCPHNIKGGAVDDGPIYDSTRNLEEAPKGKGR